MSDSRDMRRSDDDLLAEIGAALTVEPSPAFRDSVQRRVAGAESRARFSGAGWWQVVGLAAGVALAVTLAARFGTAGPGPSSELAPTSVGPVTARVPESPAPTSTAAGLATTPARVATSPAPPVRAVARSGQSSGVAPADGRKIWPAGPDLVVLTSQPAVLLRMWAGLSGGVVESVGADRSSASPSNGDDAQISITQLTVAPIVIPDMTVETAPAASGAGGAGVRRVVSAEQSARSR